MRYHRCMARIQSDIVEQLRAAIADSGMTRLEVSRRAGLAYSCVHGFVGEYRGISLTSAAALCKVLGLELRPVAKPKRRQRTKGR